jgi:hypothetical protein
MSGTAVSSTQGGNIFYDAATDITLTVLNAASGNVAVNSGGDIVDGQNDTVGFDPITGFSTQTGDPRVANILANSVSLRASGSIGQVGNPLDITVDNVAAQTDLGDLYVYESDAVVITTVGPIAVTRVHLESTTASASAAQLSGIVSTSGHAKVETILGSMTVDQGVAAGNDILLAAGGAGSDIILSDTVSSNLGSVSVQAGRDIIQNADISALGTGSIYLRAHLGSITMDGAAESTSASNNIVYEAALNVTLGRLVASANSVSVVAGGNILDGQNDTITQDAGSGFSILGGDPRVENIQATNVRLQSGGSVGTSTNPLDIAAQNLAASAGVNVYLLNSGDLNITSVGPIEAARVHLDSSSEPITHAALSGVLADTGNAHVETLGGTLTVVEGTVAGTIGANNFGVLAEGDILLAAGGVGENLAIDASVGSRSGDVWLAAGNNIVTRQLVIGTETTAIIQGQHLTLFAGNNIFLPNTQVQSAEARITDANNQLVDNVFVNLNANTAGTLVLDQLVHASTSLGANTTPTTPINSVAFTDLQQQYEFMNRFFDGYSMFLRNAGDLTLQQVNFTGALQIAGDISGQAPGVYIETLASPQPAGTSNLIVAGNSTLISTDAVREAGIVLIAHNDLTLAGSIDLIQVSIGNLQRVNNLDLNASAYEGGQPGILDLPVSTEFVNRIGFLEDFRSHFDQRVRMEFGSPGESGFTTVIHFADNAFQVFQNAGDVARLQLGSQFLLQPQVADPTSIQNTGVEDGLFARDPANRFNNAFLLNNATLPTEVVIRRSLDFFLFSNGGDANPQNIVDHASYFQEVANVKSLGQPPIVVPMAVPEPVTPPIPTFSAPESIVEPPIVLFVVDVDLPVIQPKIVEIAFYQLSYDDLNENGQVESNELPQFEEVLERIDRDSKMAIESKNAGEAPTQGEIEDEKAKLLNKPDQPSGAYSIIRKGTDGKEEVLDVFSIRDWPEETQSATDEVTTEGGVVPELPPLQPDMLTPPAADSNPRIDNSDELVPPPVPPAEPSLEDSSLWDDPSRRISPTQEPPRLAGLSALTGSLWMLHTASQRSTNAQQSSGSEATHSDSNLNSDSSDVPAESKSTDYSMKARRSRRRVRQFLK